MAWNRVTKGAAILILSSALVGWGAGCGDDDGAEAGDAGGRTSDAGGTTDAGNPDSGMTGSDAGQGSDSGTSDRDAGPTVDGGGADAGSTLTAVAEITATNETRSTIEGTVTFTQVGDDVTVVYEVRNCPDGSHQTHIHGGSGCQNRRQQGMHWDGVRGEGIPDLECEGGTGTLSYTRAAGDRTTQWSIGGPAATDVVGHPVIIHGVADPGDRIGCGVIATE